MGSKLLYVWKNELNDQVESRNTFDLSTTSVVVKQSLSVAFSLSGLLVGGVMAIPM